MIDATGASKPQVGDSVVFGFRAQAFVTRAYVVGVAGLSRGDPVSKRCPTASAGGRPGHERAHDAPASATPTPTLSLEHIHKTFGGLVAIDDFSLDVYPGEVVALVGDNGAGKSTLIKIIAGVHRRHAAAC